MKRLGNFLILFSLAVFVFSCNKEFSDRYSEYSADNEHIKSVSSNGCTKQMYLYDNFGKIKERQSTFFFERYLYDENGRLEKVESAWDERSIISSYRPEQSTELVTSTNITMNHYKLYKYDKAGRLSAIENYFIKNGKKFELTSINSFEYEGALIRRENLCDERGKIMQFCDYSYDNNGNITKEKNYIGLSNPTLSYETTYKYDNYINPFRILNILGPKFYSCPNNMIEMTTRWYSNNPRTEGNKQTFIYNNKGYPVKMTYDGGVEEYAY